MDRIPRPSLAELRERVRKPRREPAMTRWLYRRLSLPLTWLLLPTRVTPHGVSWTAGTIGVLGAVAVAASPIASWAALAGLAALQLALLGDHVDGELARARKTHSVGGIFADEVAMEVAVPVALAFAIPVYAYLENPILAWALLGGAFGFARVLNLLVYFLASLFGAKHAATQRRASAPGRTTVWSVVVSWYCVTSQVIGATTILVCADLILEAIGMRWEILGVPFGLVGAYVALGVPVLGISTLANAIHGTRGEFQP